RFAKMEREIGSKETETQKPSMTLGFLNFVRSI
ncbi:hypothetical protein VCHENC02_2957, partial [Vibrio harveyi]